MSSSPSTDFAASSEETDEAEKRASIVAAAWHGWRLDKALVAVAGEFSRSHLQTLIEQGHVKLDGQVADGASRKVRAGQALEIELVPTAQSRAFRAEAMTLSVVFEDEHLLVVDKPAGLVVHPAAGNWSGTLLNGVLAHHPGAMDLPRAGIVHRLDKDTSGLMVVGKTLPAVTALSRAIAAREVHREYVAIAHGRVPADAFSIDKPLARDPLSRVKMAIVASGKAARTDIERIALRESADGIFSAVRCRLHTGRTHQIRVHMASVGYPLVSDALYGGRASLGLQRQALHAVQLGFSHPFSGRAMSFDAMPPHDVAVAWQLVTKGVDTA